MSNREDEKLEGHNYDGIEELDNALPDWWINLFYLTIVFGLGYFAYYSAGDGPTLLREYEHAQMDYQIEQAKRTGTVKVASEDDLKALLKEPKRIAQGKEIFQSKCISCHGSQGEGGIGPNLTDDYWIHGGKMSEILAVVTSGVLDKGMPPWGPALKQEELQSVVAYVKSLRGTHPPNPKAPQGVLVKE